ncbi:MAG: DMT family transporter [Selenomonadaceae bacterium]
MTDKKHQVLLALFAPAVIWGFQPVLVKYLVAAWTPVTVTFMRYVLASAILFSFMAWRHEQEWRPKAPMVWVGVIGMGLFGIFLDCVLQFTGIKTTVVTNVTLISATTPAMTALLAAVFLRERLSLIAWGGIVISFFGVMLVVSHGSLDMVMSLSFNFGDILCLASQLAWALYSLIGLYVLRHTSLMTATAWSAFFGAILTGIYGVVMGELVIVPIGAYAIGSYLYITLLGGIMSQLCWNYGVHEAGPSITSVFLNVMPVVGMMAGYFLMGDEMGIVQLTGAASIFAGVWLTTHSSRK